MGIFGASIIFLLALMSIARPVYATPDEADKYTRIVEVNVFDIFLFNLIRDINGCLTPENIQSVFERILTKHHVSLENCRMHCLKFLESKLGRLWKNWKSANGSSGRQKLLNKWGKSVYTMKVQHKTGSPTKRKLETELKNESCKRRKLENELNNTGIELTKSKEESSELQRKLDRLSNPLKRQRGERGRSKGKVSYSQSQKRRQKDKKIKMVRDMLGNFSDMGCNAISVQFKNNDGEIIHVFLNEENSPVQKKIIKVTKEEIDEMIFLMDSCNITDRAYHEVAQQSNSLPRLCSLKKRRHELNSTFEIQTLVGDYEGVFKSLTSHLVQTLSSPSKKHLIKDENVKIKLSGDGTRAGTKKHLINVSYTIIGDEHCQSERGNYLLAIVQCPETGECIQKALKELIDEFNSIDSVTVGEKVIRIDKFLGGDLKFLNQVTGIGGFASIFSCLWCKCPKTDRADMSKVWSMTDRSKGARTVEEIIDCSQKPKSSKTRFNCNSSPIFPSVPISKVIPDTLHLFLRIMDQLVYQLTFYLQQRDNIVRLNPDLKLETCSNLMRFQQFINHLGITDWKYVVKDSKIQARTFTGPEHRRILSEIDLAKIIPGHPKLEQIKTLWSSFRLLMGQMNRESTLAEIDEFHSSAKDWVILYRNVYLAKDITPYMHVLSNHVHEVMRLYGNPSFFCQQGLEKLNDFVTKWYFRSSNFGKDALKQVMQKQNRLRYLETNCKRSPKWKVKCSSCKKEGHNRLTCLMH